MPRGKRYTGILAQPIFADEHSPDAVSLRFHALAKHYGLSPLDPDFQRKLISELISAHVPGFQVRRRKPKGRRAQYSMICFIIWEYRKRRAASHRRDSEIIRSMSTGTIYRRLGFADEKGFKRLEKLIHRYKDMKIDRERFMEDWNSRLVFPRSGT